MSRDTNFYYSFLVLPPAKRRAIIAVWDFCRAIDDSVDVPTFKGAISDGDTDVTVLTTELTRWRSEVVCCFGAEEPCTKQGRRLKPHVTRFNLSRQPFEDLIDGVEMDVGTHRYETFDELHQYCLRVAAAVGLICIEIFGYHNPRTREYAIALGVALQLTNIIRDIRGDLESGRIYLPLEDLRRFECSDEDLSRGASPHVRKLLEFECRRARSFYQEARSVIPAEDSTSLVPAQIMGAIYLAVLERIERLDYDVFSDVVEISRSRRAVIAAGVWARTIFLGPSTANVKS